MRIEVSCPACGSSFLMDEKLLAPPNSRVPCPACGAEMPVPELASATPSASGASAPQHASKVVDGAGGSASEAPAEFVESPLPPSSSDASPQAPPAGTVATASAATPIVESAADEPLEETVVCPRCKLHFQPRKRRHDPDAEHRKTVLVVEDMEYFQEIARDALTSRFELKSARTFAEAWQALAGGGVDLMVLDLTLGESGDGGRVLLQELRVKPCPILIFTARDESEMYGQEWEELQALGADDMLLKGMNVGESLLRKSCELLGEPWGEEDLG